MSALRVVRALGLSGGVTLGWAARAEGDAALAACSRRHVSATDLTTAPWAVWPTGDVPFDATGLGSHISEVVAPGQAVAFTDALVVLSRHDAARIPDLASWTRDAARTLEIAFGELLSRMGAQRARGRRDLGLRVLVDGEEGGPRFDLEAGTFLSVLVPQTYAGALASSGLLATVEVRFPGDSSWTPAAALFDDGLAVTLGSHWTDAWVHPGLRTAGLYRLWADGRGLVHAVGAGLEDRFSLHTFDIDGEDVHVLATRTGAAVAYVRLVGPSGPVRARTEPVRTVLVLERAAMVQKVPFRSVIDGYDLQITGDGRLGTSVALPAALLRVRDRGAVSLFACEAGVYLDEREMHLGEERPLTRDARIRVREVELFWHDVRDATGTRWPYIGELRRSGAVFPLQRGGRVTLGRDPASTIALPDDRRNGTIHWSEESGTGAMVTSGGRSLARADIYLDSVNVASAHAVVDVSGPAPIAECVAKNSFVYVRRRGEVSSLWPVGQTWPHSKELSPGDEIIVGNCLFEVRYMPEELGLRPAAPDLRAAPGAPQALGGVIEAGAAVSGASSAPPPPRSGVPRPPAPPPVTLPPLAPTVAAPAPAPAPVPPPSPAPAPPVPAPDPPAVEPLPPAPPAERDPLDDLLDAPAPNMSRLMAAGPISVELREAVRGALSEALKAHPRPWVEGGAGRDAIVALLHARRPDRIGKLHLHVERGALRAAGVGGEEFLAWWASSGLRAQFESIARSDTLRGEVVDEVARIVQRRLESW